MRGTITTTTALALAVATAQPATAADLGVDARSWPAYGNQTRSDWCADADALALLSPLSRRSTANQDYGDAAYARARGYRRPPRPSGYGEATDAGYQSTPERPFGFRPGFTYGPAYLSAPQIFGGSRLEQTPLLPFLGE